MRHKSEFCHESLQDGKSIQKLLQSIAKGLGKGTLEFTDEEGQLTLNPSGLLDLKVTVNEDETRHQLELRVSWNKKNKALSDTIVKVK